MGYFKQLEIELQEISDPYLREVVEWKRAHQHMLTNKELWDIMTDQVKQDAALAEWRGVPSPRSARDHVALQVRRRDLRPKRPSMVWVGWLLIGVALFAGVTVLVVNL
jgi:hypothetical protein